MTTLWTIVTTVVLSVGLTLLATAEEQSVAGNWNGTVVSTTGNSEKFRMALMQSGEEVTGIYTVSVVMQMGRNRRGGSRETTEVPVKGTLTGNKLSLEIGQEGTLEATINGNSMSGTTVRGTNAPANVSATRAKY